MATQAPPPKIEPPVSSPPLQRKPVRRRRRRIRIRRGPGWMGRLRYILWSWWIWAVGALAFLFLHRSYSALGLMIAALLTYLFAPRESSPVYGLNHEFPLESDEFLMTVVGATGTPFLPGNALDIYNNGD